MALTRLDSSTRISDKLNMLSDIVKSRSRAGLTDANQVLEAIATRFLNALFGWQLSNLNIEQANYPAADLGDRRRRIAIQVTNEEGPDKIRRTTDKAVEHRLGAEFDRLIVFFLLPRKPNFPRNFVQPPHGPQIETWDIADLLKVSQNLEDLGRLEQAATVLDEELGKLEPQVPPADSARLLSAYQGHVRQKWERVWSGGDSQNKPPFIETQELRLLLQTERPERFLHPEYFRVGRGPRSAESGRPLGEWGTFDRGELAGNVLTNTDGSPCDLSRLVITTDAGIGKTTTMLWLENELSQPGAPTAAFYLTFSRLPPQIGELLPDLARRMLQAEGGNAEGASLKNALRVLEMLRHEGRLTLLLDALDQEPADGSAASLVRQLLLDEPAWRACRIVISGRPFALQRHWWQLFATELGCGWRFMQVDEFTPDEQRRFLGADAHGKSRVDLIPQEAREILSTPRVLSYLRDRDDGELKKIRTGGDVYWLSIEHLLIQGMLGSEAARRIGLDATEPTPAKVQARSKQRALKLLAAIAFEMTSTPVARTSAAPGEPTTMPNFDGVRRNRFDRFRMALLRRLSRSLVADGADILLNRDLDGLAALNDFIAQGLFDTAVEGLQELFWRNRSLQEFFTALWLAQYATEEDASLLWDWLYLPDRPQTEEYYWIWRFLCEMPTDVCDPDSWLRSVEPIYRPGDGTIAGTRRSCEFLYRAWAPLGKLIGQGEQAAFGLRDRFLGEFENESLSGKRGEAARQLAAEFRNSFLAVPAGEFCMGAPPEKQGMGEALRKQWKAYLEQEGDPEERARQHVARWSFTPGKRGEKERQISIAWYAQIFRDKDLDRLEQQQFAHDETPMEATQKVEAFRLCRCPTLNGWYRLFAPGHGEVDSTNLDEYRAASATPGSPVIFVSWYDAWAFALWTHWEGCSCRLPREYEWEYAAKADTPWDQNYWWGDEFDPQKCNADRKAGHATPPSAAHANPWGFEDILGNVGEWCEDWYRPAYDRQFAEGASYRVIRGGGWSSVASYCRSADRSRDSPDFRGIGLGFRVARSAVQ